MDELPQDIRKRLAEPFAAHEVKFKPQSVKGNRALALAYVDARTVMDRLDAVLNVDGWEDEYTTLPDGSVKCCLSLKINGEWVGKEDVGSPSEQPDEGDRTKAAHSDALKRAAVKWGVGRYLYRLAAVWCDYDPQKKRFSVQPLLPVWALPGATKAPTVPYATPEEAPPPPAAQAPTLPRGKSSNYTGPTAEKVPPQGGSGTAPPQGKKPPPPPATVKELWNRMFGMPDTDDAEELVNRVLKAEGRLVALDPAYEAGKLLAAVLEFARVADLEALKRLPSGRSVSAAWANACQFMKARADLQQQPAAESGGEGYP